MANELLGSTGTPFWQDESFDHWVRSKDDSFDHWVRSKDDSFDHWVRSAQELHDLIEYVENNPVQAGLVGA